MVMIIIILNNFASRVSPAGGQTRLAAGGAGKFSSGVAIGHGLRSSDWEAHALKTRTDAMYALWMEKRNEAHQEKCDSSQIKRETSREGDREMCVCVCVRGRGRENEKFT